MPHLKYFTLLLFFTAICCKYSDAQVNLEELSNIGEEYMGENALKLDSVANLIFQATDADQNSSYRSIAFNFNGVSSAMQGDLGPSLHSFQESWKIAASINDSNLQVNALTNMAGVYKFAGQPRKAEEKLLKALDLLKGDQHLQTRANTLLALGIIQEELKDYISASKNYTEALFVFDKGGDMSSYLSCVGKLGSLLMRINKLEEASALYSFVLYGRSNANQIGMTIPLFREKGTIDYRQNKLDDAKKNLERSLHLSDSLNYRLLLDSTLVMLIRVSSKMGDFESVNIYTNRLVQFHQFQNDLQVEETLASLETEYQLNEQKLVNRALEAESEKAKLQVENDRIAFFGLGLIIVLLIVIGVFAIALIRRTQRFNAQLELKVQAKTKEVLLRDQQLKTTAFKLAHELRSGVATLLGAKNLLDENGIPKGIDEELYEAIGHSTEKRDVTIKEMIKNLEQITINNGED